jgi:hypothetical protein
MAETENGAVPPQGDAASTPVAAPAARPPVSARRLVESWQDAKMTFAVLLAAFHADASWLARLETVSERVLSLLEQDADVALYMLQQTATNEIERYSAHHALFCAVVAHLCSGWFDAPAQERRSLFAAALTMNLGMQSMQDAMARQAGELSPDQRRRIDEHPAIGVEMLRSAGVTEALWLDVVARHHQPIAAGECADPLLDAQRLAELLHRIDVFTAKLSRRRVRAAASATVAARHACLDASGHPDAIGATLLRVLGLYPPGSYVRLANGELAVVVRRGAKAHAPVVASLRRPDGTPYSQAVRRDTSERSFAVQRAVVSGELKMVLNHERILGG